MGENSTNIDLDRKYMLVGSHHRNASEFLKRGSGRYSEKGEMI